MMLTCFRNGASGCRISDRSKLSRLPPASTCPSSRRAGSRSRRIASCLSPRSGRAPCRPAPSIPGTAARSTRPRRRRNVRRDRCFLVMNIVSFRIATVGFFIFIWNGVARDDAEDERRESVVVLRSAVHHRPHRRHVEVLHRAAERVGEEFLGRVGRERVGSRQQGRPQIGRTVQLRAVHELAGRVHRRSVRRRRATCRRGRSSRARSRSGP